MKKWGLAKLAVWLGIDYGLARCGLALSTPDERLVYPLATLDFASFHNRKNLLDHLAALASKHETQNIVLGLPLLLDGAESLTCAQIRNAAKRIKRRLPLPMFFMSEYLSSQEAERDLLAAGLTGKKMKAVLDQAAACRILESFLAQPLERRQAA